jgi:hypothetical protein
VICDNNIGFFKSFSRFEKGTLPNVGATAARTLVLIR